MNYSLDIKEVKKVIDAKLAGKPFNEDQFMYYHLNRNHFNVKEIRFLKHKNGSSYVDNLGRIWEVQPDYKNYYHMPKTNWLGSNLGISAPYSRKFLLDDTDSGLDGEYEMIIRQDGKRIDALTHETYQETYNFGRTRDTSNHILLDVDPHKINSGYAFRQNMGKVTVTE